MNSDRQNDRMECRMDRQGESNTPPTHLNKYSTKLLIGTRTVFDGTNIPYPPTPLPTFCKNNSNYTASLTKTMEGHKRYITIYDTTLPDTLLF